MSCPEQDGRHSDLPNHERMWVTARASSFNIVLSLSAICCPVTVFSESGKQPRKICGKLVAFDVGIGSCIPLWPAVEQHLNGVDTSSVGT